MSSSGIPGSKTNRDLLERVQQRAISFWGGWGCSRASATGCGVGNAFYAVWWSLLIEPGVVARRRVSSIKSCAHAVPAALLPSHGGHGGLWLYEGPKTTLSKTPDFSTVLGHSTWLFCTFHKCYSTGFVLRPSQDCYSSVSLQDCYSCFTSHLSTNKRTRIHNVTVPYGVVRVQAQGRKMFSVWEWWSAGTGCAERLWSLVWRYSKPMWTPTCSTCRGELLWQGIGPDDLQRSLPTPTVLWTWSKTSRVGQTAGLLSSFATTAVTSSTWCKEHTRSRMHCGIPLCFQTAVKPTVVQKPTYALSCSVLADRVACALSYPSQRSPPPAANPTSPPPLSLTP